MERPKTLSKRTVIYALFLFLLFQVQNSATADDFRNNQLLRSIQTVLTQDFYGFQPKIDSIKSGSGLGLGIQYTKRNLISDLSFHLSAVYSTQGYEGYAARFGKFQHRDSSLFSYPIGSGGTAEFGAVEKGKNFYFDVRHYYLPKEDFFGTGPDSLESNRSDFLLNQTSYDAVAEFHLNDWFATQFQAGYLEVDVASGSDRGMPDLQTLFGNGSVAGMEQQPDFFRLGGALLFDFRDNPDYPHAGNMLGLSFTRYEATGNGAFDFNSFMIDYRHYVPLHTKTHVLALRAYASIQDADSGANVPFYFLESLGGSNLLRGFDKFRFRDNNLLYFSTEYRWEVAKHLELAAFYDMGKVFPDFSGFHLKDLENSVGLGIRFKTSDKVLFGIDAARSEEGTKIYFRFSPNF